MFEQNATIRNARGIHSRPATAIAEAMRDYPGRARVLTSSSHEECDAASVLGLMSLGLESGSRVRVEASSSGAVSLERPRA